jgi:hypothetical protein
MFDNIGLVNGQLEQKVMSHEKVEEKLSKVFLCSWGNLMHGVVEEYISSCYMRKCLGGGEF